MAKKRPALTVVPAPDFIQIRGARQNNLKGFDLDLPLGKLIVVTGPSGSGKSSLAFDTVYAEGQRRYVETFSPYTRQFLDRMDKPQVDEIRGIPPAIAIEQSNHVKSTRSTVGTMTDINDYLKLLFPRIATAHCPKCERQIRSESVASILAQLFAESAGDTVLITFRVAVPAGTKPADFFGFLTQQGYLRIWLDDEVVRTDEPAKVKSLPAMVAVIQDRIAIAAENRTRMSEAIETALRLGSGKVQILNLKSKILNPHSAHWHCAHCDHDITPPSPGLFSFNHPQGACPTCRGFGRTISIDLPRAVPDHALSIAAGCVKPFQTENGQECQRDLLRSAAAKGVNVRVPFRNLTKRDQDWLLHGEDHAKTVRRSGEELWKDGLWYGVRGFFNWLETKAYKMHVRVFLSRYRNYTECPDCRGARYQPAVLNFRVAEKTLPALQLLPIAELHKFLSATPPGDGTSQMLLGEVSSRLGYLVEVGLGYLSLDRPTRTLSGGETERVNLTTCLGASLVNTLFVLDEPSVGLHPRDTGRLIRIMQSLRDRGNTLLVVEHEESIMRAADHLVEIGPGRGEAGGRLVFSGSLAGLLGTSAYPTAKKRASRSAENLSLTAAYLSGERSIPLPARRRVPTKWLRVEGATAHNLRDLSVEIPLGVFACVTGVSGSGKSTLVHSVLYEQLLRARGLASEHARSTLRGLHGVDGVGEVILVDQSPLARTPKSTPALYLGVFDAIRERFACTPEALREGLSASAFSFNGGAGRCERCGGSGYEKIEMQFLSDVFVRCPECEGSRYQPHILKIRVAGKSIADVLALTVAEAVGFFEMLQLPRVVRPLRVLEEVGLGYLRLGQPLNILSGGESQRLKLVERLAAPAKHDAAPTLLILDEPTTGLHFDDIAILLRVLDRLVEQGHSLVVIEHNLEVIKCADYVLDLGPEAGTDGGQLVGRGTPEEVALVHASHTGRYLRGVLAGFAASGVEWESDEAARVAEVPFQPPTAGISIHGAREHNLKDISLTIPRDQFVVITGLSGSGKSTLAFDLLFAEGQRRFLDVMSPYARQFVEQMEKPDVDLITGLPPSVAIEQRVTRGGGKSTVATVTEVYHFLRLLFSKLGTQHCPGCGCAVKKQTAAAVVKRVAVVAGRGKTRVFATLVKARKGFHTDVAKWAKQQGFSTLLVDGALVAVKDFEKLERFREHTIEVLVGELKGATGAEYLVKRALEIGRGTIRVLDAKGRATILSTERACPDCGQSFEELDPRMFSYNSPHGWCAECRGFGEVWKRTENPRLETELEKELDVERQSDLLDDGEAAQCPQCMGARLNPQARAVRLQGHAIGEIADLAVHDAMVVMGKLRFAAGQQRVAQDIVPEILQRLRFMGQVGLDYLALGRSAKTLSGGESQRIRLAAQLGSNLRGVLYVLDEPTIGLHPRDNRALLDTLLGLKAKGNSLIVVEHDEDTMRHADTVIDLGPGAGSKGGRVVAQGTLGDLQNSLESATGRSFREPMRHPTRGARRTLDGVRWLELLGAKRNNLKCVDARFPIGRLTVITGISGSGKSTLMRGVLKPAVVAGLAAKKARKSGKGTKPARADYSALKGIEYIEALYEVDQAPIGKTSRSTPATYLGIFDAIRALFAQVPASRMRGYTASRFSFNTVGGRCETCAGQGAIKMEMAFLPTSWQPCTDCHGKRYNPATLEVLYDGRSIGDVMEMSLAEAAAFFAPHKKIYRPLALLCDTGLGYLRLGQPSPTLSGGEAQRLKLVYELASGAARESDARLRKMMELKSTLYLLEEPTIGLHMLDVAELLKVLHQLVDSGATVVVIEHHLNLIADADYVLDIGPEAGAAGGELVASGTPEQVGRSKASRTAPFLRAVLR